MVAETRTLTAQVPIELAQEVDALSELLERPRQWIVKKALVQFLAREAEKRRLVQEGLDDVSAGRMVSMEQGNKRALGPTALERTKNSRCPSVTVKVLLTSKAMSDMALIAEHVKKFNDGATARRIVNALFDEAERLGQDPFHRLGEELGDYDGPPAREVHRWAAAQVGTSSYEVLPAYAEEPTTIAILRVWDTR